jgi:hypothetical protein
VAEHGERLGVALGEHAEGAAAAARRSRSPIEATTARGSVPAATSRVAPSGSVSTSGSATAAAGGAAEVDMGGRGV